MGVEMSETATVRETTIRKVRIGEFTLYEKEYGGAFWIYKQSGEGISLPDVLLEKFEKHIKEFYDREF